MTVDSFKGLNIRYPRLKVGFLVVSGLHHVSLTHVVERIRGYKLEVAGSLYQDLSFYSFYSLRLRVVKIRAFFSRFKV